MSIIFPAPPVTGGMPVSQLISGFMNGAQPPPTGPGREAYFDILLERMVEDNRDRQPGQTTAFSWCCLLASEPAAWAADLTAAKRRRQQRLRPETVPAA